MKIAQALEASVAVQIERYIYFTIYKSEFGVQYTQVKHGQSLAQQRK